MKFKLSYLKGFVGIGLSVCLLIFMIEQSDLSFSMFKLNGEQSSYFVMAMCIFVFTIWLNAERVKIISPFDKPISAMSSILVGNFYNCMLPVKIGDGIRVLQFSRKNNISFTASFAMLVVEKVIDTQVFAWLILIWFATNGFVSNAISNILLMLAVGFLGGFALLIFLIKSKNSVKWLFKTLVPVKYLRVQGYRIFLYFRAVFCRMGTPQYLFKYIGFGAVQFLFFSIQFLLIMNATDVFSDVRTLPNCFYLCLCMIIISFLPSPGNIGVVHYGLFLVLLQIAEIEQINITPDIKHHFGLFTFYVHLSYFLPNIVIGLFTVLKERKTIF